MYVLISQKVLHTLPPLVAKRNQITNLGVPPKMAAHATQLPKKTKNEHLVKQIYRIYKVLATDTIIKT